MKEKMLKILVGISLYFFTITTALADSKFCDYMARVAETIMLGRQYGVSANTSMKQAVNAFGDHPEMLLEITKTIKIYYLMPIRSNDIDKEKEIQKAFNDTYNKCISRQ